MRAKNGYRQDKDRSPHIGRKLKRYFARRTCRRMRSRRGDSW